jgi:hypothetical protein
MPKDHQAPRQRPVSCGFCRRRKLRCSRDAPCSNCVSRGVSCDLEDNIQQTASHSDEFSQSEILERLRRLEQLLAAQQPMPTGVQNHAPASKNASSDTCSTPAPANLASQIQSLGQDVALLESIYLSDQIPKVGCSSPIACIANW